MVVEHRLPYYKHPEVLFVYGIPPMEGMSASDRIIYDIPLHYDSTEPSPAHIYTHIHVTYEQLYRCKRDGHGVNVYV